MQEIIACDANGNSISGLVQWDNNVYIYLSDGGIDKAYQVHFFNSIMNEAFVVNSVFEDNKLKVKIPNDLLVQPYGIAGYINVVKDDESKCMYGFKINVRKKPKPSTLVYVGGEDYVSVESIRDECKQLADEIKGYRDDIEAFRDTMESTTQSATNAARSANTAAGNANKATQNANTAAAAANAAAQAADPEGIIAKLNMGELTQASTLAATDKLLVGTSGGTKSISANDALFGILDACVSVEQRRNIFRGKNLGAAFTAEQKANIKNGSFKGFFIGDYWSIGGITWRIADINYWQNCGDNNACTTPHLVIMPDSQLYVAQMNETNVTTGGYVGSKMYTENLEEAKTMIAAAFGSANILTHREYLTNAVTNGYPSGGAWYDSTVELPNEIMMYGSYVYTSAVNGSESPNKYTIDKTQLALMRMHPKFINLFRQPYWLRGVVSEAHFADVNTSGYVDYGDASFSLGVRPVFGIIG